MDKTAKTIVGVIIVALVVWGVYALASKDKQDSGGQVSGDTYKIGVILPLTGDAASYGEPARQIYELAVEEINKTGVDGKKLELVVEDGKCNGKDAASAMTKLVEVDKVQVVIGGFCSSESLASVPIAETGKVALFSAGSSSPDLTGKSRYFVRNYPSDATQGSVLAEVGYNKEGFRKVAVLQEQQDYALGIYNAFNTKFQELGGTTTKEEYPKEGTDFRSQLTKLRGQNPDALFLSAQTPQAAERILKQLNDLQWKPRLFASDILPGDPTIVEANKAVLEGTLVAEFSYDVNNAKMKHLLEAYKAKYGKDLIQLSYAQTEYDAVYMVTDAIKEVGYDGTKIIDWLRAAKDWEGASGKVTIGTNGDRVGGHRPEVIVNGKVQLYTK